ncbi:MAG: helix-turn-helix domain-containing protein, partial [Pseudomonadota bacterium]|nr:helix-turn-helix domain-containing protein [Pseudomonadota bacterium]
MNDVPDAPAPAPAAKPTAGRLLREAREKQGLHIAALAAAIKVSPKKLELLESDRFAELPDATFTRALAQTVCRALKTDPAPVMQLLPPPIGHRLEQLGEGLNMPFRERPGLLVQRDWSQIASRPMFWVVALILVSAAVLYLLPASFGGLATVRTRPAPAAPALPEPGMPPESTETPTTSTAPSLGQGSSTIVAPSTAIASAPAG